MFAVVLRVATWIGAVLAVSIALGAWFAFVERCLDLVMRWLQQMRRVTARRPNVRIDVAETILANVRPVSPERERQVLNAMASTRIVPITRSTIH